MPVGIAKLDPQLVLSGFTVMDASLVMKLRPPVVDLLTATGMPLARVGCRECEARG